jgi:hypothetical protein
MPIQPEDESNKEHRAGSLQKVLIARWHAGEIGLGGGNGGPTQNPMDEFGGVEGGMALLPPSFR